MQTVCRLDLIKYSITTDVMGPLPHSGEPYTFTALTPLGAPTLGLLVFISLFIHTSPSSGALNPKPPTPTRPSTLTPLHLHDPLILDLINFRTSFSELHLSKLTNTSSKGGQFLLIV